MLHMRGPKDELTRSTDFHNVTEMLDIQLQNLLALQGFHLSLALFFLVVTSCLPMRMGILIVHIVYREFVSLFDFYRHSQIRG